MATYQYDPAEVNLVFVAPGVVIPGFTGFAPGSFIQVVRDEPDFRRIVGIDRQFTRVASDNYGGTVSVVLEDASPDNLILSGIQASDRATRSAVGVLFLRDKSGPDVAMSPEAWIQRMPGMEKASTSGVKTWTFDCGHVEIFHAGIRKVLG